MAKFTLTLEIEADSLEELWSKFSHAEMAAYNGFKDNYFGWTQDGWNIEVEGESDDEIEEEAEEDGEEE